MLRHTLTGGFALAVGCVLAAGPVAHADIYAPYARAAAIVDADGRLNNFKNVISSSRVGPGRYCVRVAKSVTVKSALIQITPRDALRLPHIAYRGPSPTCGERNTLTVHVYDVDTTHLADGGFDVAIS